ncbi:MAG: hypothetical protein KF708_01675 [Pirellulales bacterium]|nr:hypothetical protein [Pirellulales bacterium]
MFAPSFCTVASGLSLRHAMNSSGLFALVALLLGGKAICTAQAWSAPTIQVREAEFERAGDLLRADQDLPRGAIARLGRAAFRQGSPIVTMAISPDGRRVATSGFEQGAPVIVRQLPTLQSLHVFHDDLSGSASLAFSPDGKWLASGSNRDRTVRVWDLETGRCRHLLRTAPYPNSMYGRRTYAAFFADGSHIISGAPDGTIQFWDVSTGREVHRLEIPANEQGQRSQIQSLIVAPRGSAFAVSTADGTVRIYGTTDKKLLQQFETAPLGVTAMSFSADGKRLACVLSGHPRHFIRGDGLFVWDVVRKQRLVTLVPKNSFSYGTSVALSPDGTRLAAVGPAYNVTAWHVADGDLLSQLDISARVVCMSPTSNEIVTGDWEGRIRRFDADTGEEQSSESIDHPGPPTQEEIRSIAFAPDSKTILTATAAEQVHQWELPQGGLRRSWPEVNPRDKRPGYRASLSPDARWCVFDLDTNFELMNLETSEIKPMAGFRESEASLFEGGTTEQHCWSADGSTFASYTRRRPSVSPDGLVRTWNMPEGTLRLEMPITRLPYLTLALTPDGSVLAVGRSIPLEGNRTEARLEVYDSTSGKLLEEIAAAPGLLSIVPAAFSRDGKWMACGSHRDEVQIWDWGKKKHHCTLRGPLATAGVGPVCFSPDGKRIAGIVARHGMVGAYRDLIHVWEVESGRVTHQFDVKARQLTFSPDSQLLGASLPDRTAIVFDLSQTISDLRTEPLPLTAEQIQDLYEELGGMQYHYLDFYTHRDDLLETLRAGGDAVLPHLRPKLLAPLDAEQAQLQSLVQGLTSDRAEERLQAAEAIAAYGDNCWAIVRDIEKSPLEPAQLDALLKQLQEVPLRRRITILDFVVAHNGSVDARRLLQEVIARNLLNPSQSRLVGHLRYVTGQLKAVRSP